ncbi:MAG TPA: NAD(P)/FAD-dependent oxidoreductase [Candidatus Sulfotelmatobacter sp.]|nr:NAD(P)/FAD-dependent oxidoreductase [Candidatus Sulfotelmatobacter sp.]
MAYDKRWDVLVIGAGLNGMTLANYLLKAGLKVMVLERRLESGGGLASEEPTVTGFWHNTGHYVFDTLNLLPFHKELDLEEVNISFVHPEVQAALPLGDGRSLVIYKNLKRTLESVAAFSRKDAQAWQRLHRAGAAGIPEFTGKALRTPARAAAPGDGDLARLALMSPREVLDELFESEVVKSLILYHLLIPRGIGYDYSGTGRFVAFAIAQAGQGQLVHEGSHEMAQGMWTAILKRGGDIWDMTEVTEILVEKGRAVGVELMGGRRMYGRAVVSTLDPVGTFRLAGERHVKPELLERLARFRPDEFSLFAVHLALKAAPRFQAAGANPDVNRAFRYAIGLENIADHAALWDEVRRGELPTWAGMFVSIPTIHDPSQALPGHHTALIWQIVPRALRGREWKDVRQEYMASCIDRLRRYAPNIGHETIMGATAMTPDDMVAKWTNLGAGLFGGRNAGGQLGAFRPLPELAGYRAPIRGLYLAGASMSPGAGLSPAPAMACTEVVAADLKAKRWWAKR